MASAGLPPRPADSKGKSWVFNPPPGWPAPPADWQPQAGWHPDPSWPPPPAGWQFWKPAPRRGLRGISPFVKAVAGILTFAATITGTYLTYLALQGPPGPTTATWVRQANAVCDQDIGSLQLSLFDGLAPSPPSTAGQNGSSTQQAVGRLRNFIVAEGSLSKQMGDLGALQTPKDDRAAEVGAVISTGNALVSSMETFSNLLQTAVDRTPGSPSSQPPPQVATELSDGDKVLTSLLAWEKAIAKLGLNRCAFWVRNPPNVAPTMTPPAAPASTSPSPAPSLTVGEQQLVNRLDPGDLTGCTGRADLEVSGVVAAVNCQAVAAGPTLRPLVVQFSDMGSAQAWFENNTVGFVDRGDCAAGYRLGTWAHNGVPAGMLGCADTRSGGFRMVWVIDSAQIGVIADGSDGTTMTAWWTRWCYVTGGG